MEAQPPVLRAKDQLRTYVEPATCYSAGFRPPPIVVGNIVVGKREEERAPATPEAFRLALEAGMPVAVGTDCGAPGAPHATLPEELRLMVEAGTTPLEALK